MEACNNCWNESLLLDILNGLCEKSEIQNYWAKWWITATPGYKKVMPRDRFEVILTFLRLENNDNHVPRSQDGHNRLFKIRPLIDLLVPKFGQLFYPRKQLAFDEMTIAFKGRNIMKHYNRNKPDKWGYETYVLSESNSAYVVDWLLSTGKQNPGQLEDDDENTLITHRIVRQMMRPSFGQSHALYVDSYYSGVPLANEPGQNETGVCGTVDVKRRGMPQTLNKKNLPLCKGDDPVFMRNGKLLALARHDVKRVRMLTNIYGNDCVMKQICSKESENGFRDVKKPYCMDRYNQFMEGVEKTDQRMKTYLFPHRSTKWYPRIVSCLLSITTVNAHILYCLKNDKPVPLKKFIQEICISLLEGYNWLVDPRPEQTMIGDRPQRLTEKHFPTAIEEGRPDCIVCNDRTGKGGRKQMQQKCHQCDLLMHAVAWHVLHDFTP